MGRFRMFLHVFASFCLLSWFFLNIVVVCFCGAYFLMVSFNASLFASPPSSISDFTCWFKREPGTIYWFVYTKNHCSVYLCVEARIYWTLNRFASVQFSKIDTSLKVLKFGSKVGSQSNACTGWSARSKRQGTGIVCLVLHGTPHVLLLFPFTKMTRSTSTKSVIAPLVQSKVSYRASRWQLFVNGQVLAAAADGSASLSLPTGCHGVYALFRAGWPV